MSSVEIPGVGLCGWPHTAAVPCQLQTCPLAGCPPGEDRGTVGTPSVGTVTAGLRAQCRGNVHQPHLGHSGSCGSSIPPHGKAAITAPLPSQHARHPHKVPPMGPMYKGFSQPWGKPGMLPLGVCAQPPRCGAARAAGIGAHLGWSRTGDGLSPGMTLKAGLAMHVSSGPGLCSWLRGLTFLVPLGFPNSISQAPFPVLTSVSSAAPPEWRFLGPGLLDMALQARFCRHTLPEVSPRLSVVLPSCFPGLSPSARCQQRASLTSTAPSGNYKTHYLFGKTLCKDQEKGWNPFSSRRPETACPPRLLFSMPALSRVKAVGAFVIKMAIVEPGNKFNIIKGAGRVSLICCSSKKSVSCFRTKQNKTKKKLGRSR